MDCEITKKKPSCGSLASRFESDAVTKFEMFSHSVSTRSEQIHFVTARISINSNTVFQHQSRAHTWAQVNVESDTELKLLHFVTRLLYQTV